MRTLLAIGVGVGKFDLSKKIKKIKKIGKSKKIFVLFLGKLSTILINLNSPVL